MTLLITHSFLIRKRHTLNDIHIPIKAVTTLYTKKSIDINVNNMLNTMDKKILKYPPD